MEEVKFCGCGPCGIAGHNRNPNFSLIRKSEKPFWQHADDCEFRVVQGDRLAYDAGVGTETALPQALANHCNHVLHWRLIFFGKEDAPFFGGDTEHFEIAVRYFFTVNSLRARIATDDELGVAVGGHLTEHVILLLPVLKIREGYRLGAVVFHIFVKHNQAVGIFEWERMQEDGSYDAEYGGVCADAEGEGENCNGGKARRSREHSCAVFQILEKRLHLQTPLLTQIACWREAKHTPAYKLLSAAAVRLPVTLVSKCR